MRLDTWGSRGLGLSDLSFTSLGKSNLRGFDDFDPDDIHSNLHRAFYQRYGSCSLPHPSS